MNKILIDIGNTNVLFGKFDNQDKLISQLRIITSSLELDNSNDNYLKEKLRINNFFDNCSLCGISGVVPNVIENLMKLILTDHPSIDCYEIDNKYLNKIIKVKIKSPK